MRNLDPTVFQPELASNLTTIIQGLVVLFVSADVLVVSILAAAAALPRRRAARRRMRERDRDLSAAARDARRGRHAERWRA